MKEKELMRYLEESRRKTETIFKCLDILKENIESFHKEIRKFSCEEVYNEEYANINGILLKRENEKLQHCEHFTYFTHEEALKLFQDDETRLPTKKEWETMLGLGSTWDEKKKGIWIGGNHKIREESRFSTFLPAAGYHNRANGALDNVGTYGYYWSSSPSSTNASHLYFSTTVNPAFDGNRSNGFSVRCIIK
jgi:uncharacterized protein (TIGR02145 family)